MMSSLYLKRCILLLITVVMLFSAAAPVSPTPEIMFSLNGLTIDTGKPSPFIDNSGRIVVPLRKLSEALGATLSWDGINRTAILEKCNTNIKFAVGKNSAIVNGKPLPIGTKAVIINQTIMVPLRFLCENTGITITWDKTSLTANLMINNGYTIPDKTVILVNTPSGTGTEEVDIILKISLDSDKDLAFQEAIDILGSKLDKSVVNDIIVYAKSKTITTDQLPEQRWRSGQQIITVSSEPDSKEIIITVTKPGT
jgi:hypothetical protein